MSRYDFFAAVCAGKGGRLATLDEYCAVGAGYNGDGSVATWRRGVFQGARGWNIWSSGDVWAPFSGDGGNAWVQVGAARPAWTCNSHHAMGAGRPVWGAAPVTTQPPTWVRVLCSTPPRAAAAPPQAPKPQIKKKASARKRVRVVELVRVAGTTHANRSFWKQHCTVIPPEALWVVVDMGNVRDFFKPIGNATFCDMLTSRRLHAWNPARTYDAVGSMPWLEPARWTDAVVGGGSDHNWPVHRRYRRGVQCCRVQTNTCPPRFRQLATTEECRTAASSLGATFVAVDRGDVPRGCYTGPHIGAPRGSAGQHRLAVLYNSHANGSANGQDAPLCVAARSPIPCPVATAARKAVGASEDEGSAKYKRMDQSYTWSRDQAREQCATHQMRLCRKAEVPIACMYGWTEDAAMAGMWFNRTLPGCGSHNFRHWYTKDGNAGAHCCASTPQHHALAGASAADVLYSYAPHASTRGCAAPCTFTFDDSRKWLSAWGHDATSLSGGCCATAYNRHDSGWGQAFTMSFGVLEGAAATASSPASTLASTLASTTSSASVAPPRSSVGVLAADDTAPTSVAPPPRAQDRPTTTARPGCVAAEGMGPGTDVFCNLVSDQPTCESPGYSGCAWNQPRGEGNSANNSLTGLASVETPPPNTTEQVGTAPANHTLASATVAVPGSSSGDAGDTSAVVGAVIAAVVVVVAGVFLAAFLRKRGKHRRATLRVRAETARGELGLQHTELGMSSNPMYLVPSAQQDADYAAGKVRGADPIAVLRRKAFADAEGNRGQGVYAEPAEPPHGVDYAEPDALLGHRNGGRVPDAKPKDCEHHYTLQKGVVYSVPATILTPKHERGPDANVDCHEVLERPQPVPISDEGCDMPDLVAPVGGGNAVGFVGHGCQDAAELLAARATAASGPDREGLNTPHHAAISTAATAETAETAETATPRYAFISTAEIARATQAGRDDAYEEMGTPAPSGSAPFVAERAPSLLCGVLRRAAVC